MQKFRCLCWLLKRIKWQIIDLYLNIKILILLLIWLSKKYIRWIKFFITLKYQNVKGEDVVIKLFGSAAFTMQQEIDHLNGKLIID